jgi:hypothetical protein
MKPSALLLFVATTLAGCGDRDRPTRFLNATAQEITVTYASRIDGRTRSARIRGGGQSLLVSIHSFSDLGELRVETPRRALVATGRQFAGPLSTCADRCVIRFEDGDRLNFSIPPPALLKPVLSLPRSAAPASATPPDPPSR